MPRTSRKVNALLKLQAKQAKDEAALTPLLARVGRLSTAIARRQVEIRLRYGTLRGWEITLLRAAGQPPTTGGPP